MHPVSCLIVSASDVTPMERWLNVWCIWHTKVETLQEFRSGSTGNKNAVTPNPLTKEESRRVYNSDDKRYQHQLNAGFEKISEIFKVRSIESLK